MQPAAGDEYTEKYSRGRRGAPAKGVGRLYRRESSNLSFSANKKGTFVYQKFLFCLSIAKAMAYHHALACISSPQAYIINRRLYRFRNDDIQTFGLMIYRNKLRMIYTPSA